MTSTDFAARYRLLKNVATRGARSFLAQQVALGRMVMVHYLDSETPEQRSATLSRLDALKPPAREKLLEIVDVDGSPVAVTLFISSFGDFSTWLDQVSPVPQAAPGKAAASTPGEFTRAFSKIETPATPPVMAHKIEPAPPRQAPPAAPPPPPPRAAKPPGDFTRIFGKVDAGDPTAAPAARTQTPSSPTAGGLDSPTLIIETPKAAPRSAPSAPPPSPAPTDAGAGFTAIFGRVGETHLPDNLPAETPKPAAATPEAGRVMQPAAVPDFHHSAAPVSPPPSTPGGQSGGGEFTQLFQRLSATAPPASMPPAAAPPIAPAVSFGPPSAPPRSIDQPPRADLMPPPMPSAAPPLVLPPPSLGAATPPTPSFAAPTPPMPSFGAPLPAPALGMTPPSVSPSGPRLPDVSALPNVPASAPNVPLTPPSPWGVAPRPASAGMFGGGGAQSEYTRILGKVTVPPPPPIAIQPPAPANASAPGQKASKSMLPLIVALNLVVLLTVAIVAYFVFRK